MPSNFRFNQRNLDKLTTELQRELSRRPLTVPVRQESAVIPNHLALDDEEVLVLDRIRQIESDNGTADIGTIRDLLGQRDGDTVAVSLRETGYLRSSPHAWPRYYLTQNGKKAINFYRRTQAREDLLTWLYGFAAGNAADTTRFTGPGNLAPYTPDETQAAVEFLRGKKLVEAPRGAQAADGSYFTVWITERGREAYEEPGTLDDFLNRSNQPMGNTQHINVEGSGNTIAAASGDNNTITVTVENFDITKVREIVSAVQQSRDALQLPAEADALIDTVQRSEERGIIHRAAAELYRLVAATSTGTLGTILAPQLAQALGIG